MAPFDPYHQWLGIPSDQQPASHYRLLGLEQFESDAKVIESQSLNQIAEIRNHQIGEHSEQASQLLNELSRARICLLDPDRKAAYDSELAATQLPLSPPPPAVPLPDEGQPEKPSAARLPPAVKYQPEAMGELPAASESTPETVPVQEPATKEAVEVVQKESARQRVSQPVRKEPWFLVSAAGIVIVGLLVGYSKWIYDETEPLVSRQNLPTTPEGVDKAAENEVTSSEKLASKPEAVAATPDTEAKAVAALEQLGATIEMNTDGSASVDFAFNTRVSDGDLVHLEGLLHLTQLDLTQTAITDVGLDCLSGIASLTNLELFGTQVTDGGLERLQGLKLAELSIPNGAQTDLGLQNYLQLTTPIILELGGWQITDAALIHLQGLSELQSLRLNITQVGDAGLAQLKDLQGLTDLDLSSTQVSDVGLEHLKGLKSLRRLNLRGTQITDAGLGHLKGLTELTILNLLNTQVTGAGLESLAEMQLEQLAIPLSVRTAQGLKNYIRIVQPTTLDLSRWQISDVDLESLKLGKNLTHLILTGTTVTNDGLAYLQGQTGLTTLLLDRTTVTDAGLQHLKGLSNLEILFLQNTAVTDAGLEHLASQTNLRS